MRFLELEEDAAFGRKKTRFFNMDQVIYFEKSGQLNRVNLYFSDTFFCTVKMSLENFLELLSDMSKSR